MTLDLSGRVALVTGAYRGLGFAIARGFAQAGARVILNGRKPAELAAAVEKLAGDRLRDERDGRTWEGHRADARRAG